MKRILLLTLMAIIAAQGYAQMTLSHIIPSSIFSEAKIINLANSGKKIMVFPSCCYNSQPDTIFFYNIDYSLWKIIPCPAVYGKVQSMNFPNSAQTGGIFFPSETLFNLDTLLEVAVFYMDKDPFSSANSGFGTFYIVNENGVFTDSITQVADGHAELKVQKVGTAFKATVNTMTGISVYDLPGSLPCDVCDGALNSYAGKQITTEPLPNPSFDHVKITFQLPEGSDRGELQLFNVTGSLIKKYQIDERFGFLLLDNTELRPGIYFYKIVTNNASASRKMLVIK